MNLSRPAPMPLKIVAYLYLIEGFLWLELAVAQTVTNHFVLPPVIFVPLVGWGLLKLNTACYQWAVAWCFICLFICLFLLWWAFAGSVRLLVFNGVYWLPAVAGIIGVVKLAQLRILLSAPVHAVFYLREAK
jgi:hypothetical protein